MEELAAAEVYAPRTIQVWRTLLNWLSFFFQIFAQILRGSLLSSAPHAPPQFKPLPVVELSELSDEPEEAPPPQRSSSSAVPIFGGEESAVGPSPLEKLTVVLDLDETLVCAYETSSLPILLRSQATEAGIRWFELECISSDKEFEGKPKINYVTVFERPGLKEFLKQLSEFADLVLFTAGLEGYARPLVDRIDAEHRFSRRFYRPSTISTEYREHVKDLAHLSKDLCRIVIVDNNPFSFLLQPLNGIPCIPFSPGQPHDKQVTNPLVILPLIETSVNCKNVLELLDVILPLLKHLSLQNDVRPALYERYHMPEWFQKHGVPASGPT
ncbi:hypothetical protein OROGR_011092 [Orobanche gracilis]